MNKNKPADLVPYWDFNAQGIPDKPRYAAAAVAVSVLYKRCTYATDSAKSECL